MSGRVRREVALGLGSNIGDKAAHIGAAVALLTRDGLVEAAALSSLYRTAPWGKTDQDWFINACLVGETTREPLDMLAAIKTIERAVGRTATTRWGPRVIDIDMLYLGDVVMETDRLALPHRDLATRAFVLAPLADLRPDRRFGGITVSELLARLGDQGIERLAARSP